jgi:alpha-amylase
VLLSNAGDAAKWMQVGSPNTAYVDVTEHITDTVVTDDEGWAEFRCRGRSVSVWVPR